MKTQQRTTQKAEDEDSSVTTASKTPKPTVEDVIERMATAASEGRLLLFVGTGFSRAVLEWKCKTRKKVPGWTELLKVVCKDVGLPPRDFVWCPRSRKLNLDCPAIATAMAKAKDRSGNSLAIKESAAKKTVWIPRKIQKEEVGEILLGLNPSAIVTTNYDEVLEGLLGASCESLARRDEVRVPARGKTAVWHFHGRRDEPKNLVLTREDYIWFFRPGNYAQTKLAELLHDHFTVFVGYSLSDMNLLSALDWAQNVFQSTNGFPGCVQLEKSKSDAGGLTMAPESIRQVVLAYDKNRKEPGLADETSGISCPVILTDDVIRLLQRIFKKRKEMSDDREEAEGARARPTPTGRRPDENAVASLLSSASGLETTLDRLAFECSDKSSQGRARRTEIIETLREAFRKSRLNRIGANGTADTTAIDPERFLAGLMRAFPLSELPVSCRIRFLEEMERTLSNRQSRDRLSRFLTAYRFHEVPSIEPENLAWLRDVAAYGGCRKSESFARRILRLIGKKNASSRT